MPFWYDYNGIQMTITLYRTEDRTFLNSFFTAEKVWELTSVFKPWTETGFQINPESAYLVAAEGEDVICVFILNQWSVKTVEMHLYCAKKHWGTGKADICITNLKKLLHETLKYDIVITSAPRICTQVIGSAVRNGMQQLCSIPGGTAYKGETCDLLLFQYKL